MIEAWIEEHKLKAGDWPKGYETIHVGMLLQYLQDKAVINRQSVDAIKFHLRYQLLVGKLSEKDDLLFSQIADELDEAAPKVSRLLSAD